MDTDCFKEKILKLRTDIQETILKAQDSTNPIELDQTMMGRLSRMDAMQQREMFLAHQRSREKELIQIESALKRIETGDFGFCSLCDEEISEKRLHLNPTILTCINCAK